jgi:hypothetical protein
VYALVSFSGWGYGHPTSLRLTDQHHSPTPPPSVIIRTNSKINSKLKRACNKLVVLLMHPTEKQYMSIVLEVDTEAKWFSGKSSSTGLV